MRLAFDYTGGNAEFACTAGERREIPDHAEPITGFKAQAAKRVERGRRRKAGLAIHEFSDGIDGRDTDRACAVVIAERVTGQLQRRLAHQALDHKARRHVGLALPQPRVVEPGAAIGQRQQAELGILVGRRLRSGDERAGNRRQRQGRSRACGQGKQLCTYIHDGGGTLVDIDSVMDRGA